MHFRFLSKSRQSLFRTLAAGAVLLAFGTIALGLSACSSDDLAIMQGITQGVSNGMAAERPVRTPDDVIYNQNVDKAAMDQAAQDTANKINNDDQ